MKREGAELGIAFDGDADRIGLVDDQGRIIWGDHILILYARDVLERTGKGQPIIFDVKCSQALTDEIARAGGGALPLADIPTVVVAVSPRATSASKLEALMRCGAEPAIIARVKDERLLLDPRTLLSIAEEDAVVARLGEVLGR